MLDWHRFDNWFRTIADFFSPVKCTLCGKLMENKAEDICQHCRVASQVFFHHPWRITHVKQWNTLWLYRGNVRSALIRFKFMRRPGYGTVFGRELGQKLMQEAYPVDVITWVPTGFLRKRKRTYDQVELIAREVAWQMGLPVEKLLRKTRNNRKQSTIRGKKARMKNVAGAYAALNEGEISGKRVLLIDDIITTGATISEAAGVLKKAGAKCVYGACVAAASDATFRPE